MDLPELSFSWSVRDPSPCADAIDAVLSPHSAPVLHRLSISVETCVYERPVLHAARVDPWLRFAWRRLVGELSLHAIGLI
ncbi:hypothetical protein E2562_000951 [Oryza meyeriana var. granulata]|uniref:Uncharacterized protein n=1 Tax=Oryza meyeriana var. granulata TaxID=110450 RepID=A0A6G1CX29_9ORYZ|nr:hypothetical protein E2562_000951 [Oryza meyeriana var. granulata]